LAEATGVQAFVRARRTHETRELELCRIELYHIPMSCITIVQPFELKKNKSKGKRSTKGKGLKQKLKP
jgi:hypothetical protein